MNTTTKVNLAELLNTEGFNGKLVIDAVGVFDAPPVMVDGEECPPTLRIVAVDATPESTTVIAALPSGEEFIGEVSCIGDLEGMLVGACSCADCDQFSAEEGPWQDVAHALVDQCFPPAN